MAPSPWLVNVTARCPSVVSINGSEVGCVLQDGHDIPHYDGAMSSQFADDGVYDRCLWWTPEEGECARPAGATVSYELESPPARSTDPHRVVDRLCEQHGLAVSGFAATVEVDSAPSDGVNRRRSAQ